MVKHNGAFGLVIVIVMAILALAIWTGSQDQVYSYVYATSAHTVLLANGTNITTPQPFVSPTLLSQVYSLGPIGIVIGAGFAIFMMYFRRR